METLTWNCNKNTEILAEKICGEFIYESVSGANLIKCDANLIISSISVFIYATILYV